MFINKEEKLKFIATSRKRISFIKKILSINDINSNDIFYIEWYLLKTTQIRRTKIKVKSTNKISDIFNK